jgi:hypothetical protein
MLSSPAARTLLALAPAALAFGCGGKTSQPQPQPAAVVFEDRLVVSDNDDKTPLRIPAAQLPAPGSCRVWYPGRPPARQPPAESCAQAEMTAPSDSSWILYRPRADPRLVDVRTVDPDSAGIVLRVRVYDAQRGTYLGTRQPRRN